MGGASGGLPSITAELIAQCFLNLPNTLNTSAAVDANSDDSESVAMVTDAVVSAANVLAALSEGKKFPPKSFGFSNF